MLVFNCASLISKSTEESQVIRKVNDTTSQVTLLLSSSCHLRIDGSDAKMFDSFLVEVSSYYLTWYTYFLLAAFLYAVAYILEVELGNEPGGEED